MTSFAGRAARRVLVTMPGIGCGPRLDPKVVRMDSIRLKVLL
jgi:hypothetical protein